MAINSAKINRIETWTSDQKKAIRKVFTALDASADGSDVDDTYLSKTLTHAHFQEGEKQDLMNLCGDVRTAIANNDNSVDITPALSGSRMQEYKKKALRSIAQTIVDAQ